MRYVTAHGWGLATGVAALAAALGFGLRAFAGACDDPNEGEPAYSTWVEGHVASVGGLRLVVGGVTVVVDTDYLEQQIGGGDDEEDGDDVQSPAAMLAALRRLRAGDGVYVEGALQADATVRATLIEADDGIDASSEPVAGVVRAVGPDTLTVGGEVVTITGGGDFTTRWDQWTSLAGLRVGDVVLVDARRDAQGGLVGDEGVFRMSGKGTTVAGTIDATNFAASDPEVLVGGVWCVLDGHESITGLGGDPCDFGGDDIATGWLVVARGALRDGKVVADALHVVSKHPAAKRRGRIRGWGYVNSSDVGRVTVNGLEVVTRSRPAKAARGDGTPRFQPGQRVRVTARQSGDGRLVATRLASR